MTDDAAAQAHTQGKVASDDIAFHDLPETAFSLSYKNSITQLWDDSVTQVPSNWIYFSIYELYLDIYYSSPSANMIMIFLKHQCSCYGN